MSTGYLIEEKAEPDIVAVMLQRVIAMSPGFSAALAQQIEQQMRTEFGGRRVFVPKGTFKRLTPEQREAVYQDGLTGMTNEEIQEKHRVSRPTLYRTMKNGGRFGK